MSTAEIGRSFLWQSSLLMAEFYMRAAKRPSLGRVSTATIAARTTQTEP